MPRLLRLLAFAALFLPAIALTTVCHSNEPARQYHLQRALFRCDPMNRGLAFDGECFWVGEFGGWIRCYTTAGVRLPERDLGDGSNRYLGHGVATGSGFLAAGAWDAVTVFPRAGGTPQRITPPIAGNPCGVAALGQSIWVMNYQSPVIYEMSRDGQLLRQFTTAQQSTATSHDITIDCDGHLYVLDGAGGGSHTLFEYAPDGTLLRTHQLAVPATAVAIAPQDSNKTLYTVSFAGDPIVYEYRLMTGSPSSGSLPRLKRPLRYAPDHDEFVITNGPFRFNRPLYGTNSAFFVYAGDKPEFLLALPGKGGTLRFGVMVPAASRTSGATTSDEDSPARRGKWLCDAERIVSRYRAGAMRYTITDPLWAPGTLTLDVIPAADREGVLVRVTPSPDIPSSEIVWTFGGATDVTQWNIDTCAYCPEAVLQWKPEDCVGNQIQLTQHGFSLQAPCHQNRPMLGVVPSGTVQQVADADQMVDLVKLWDSHGGERPIVAGRRALLAGEPTYLGIQWSTASLVNWQSGDLPNAMTAAETARTNIAERVRVTTPDPYLNAAVPALCTAADGIWDPPVYVHGGVAWHLPYLGWRGAYAGSEFGWHERAQLHFKTFGDVQLKEPVTGQPHADPECNLARQAPDSVIYSRGYIPVHPQPDARGPYDMQQVYIDQLLWHLLWTGDLAFARTMWPVLVDHLQWEKRCFDPDGDGLYENVANTFISDAHHYSGGACTQASAYNYRAYSMAGKLARKLGEDPTPWEAEASRIREALQRVLWMPDTGWYAEYRDLLGLRRLHPSAELPSVYHPIDSDVPDEFQAWQMLRYVDTSFERLPIETGGTMIFASNWVPYIWSIRDISGVEVAHTALANWQVGRREEAYELWRGAIVDSMFGCRAPGACIATSEQTGRMAGLCTDFADTVGMYARTLVEGLFGIVPNALDGELLIRPGLPADWQAASIDTPDVGYSYSSRENVDSFEIRARFRQPMRLRLVAAARSADVVSVTCNGQSIPWQNVTHVGEPQIAITAPQADGAKIEIHWGTRPIARLQAPTVAGQGDHITLTWADGVSPQAAAIREWHDPQHVLSNITCDSAHVSGQVTGQLGHRTSFARIEQGQLSWWQPVIMEVRPAQEIVEAAVDVQGQGARFAVRNNASVPVAANVTIQCGATSSSQSLAIDPRAISAPLQLDRLDLVPGTNPLVVALGPDARVAYSLVDWTPCDERLRASLECLDLAPHFNDRVTNIFKHDYLSPRSPYCSMQMPLHGFGDWCYCGKSVPNIDDSALRSAAGTEGRYISAPGIPFATPGPGDGSNIIFTSQWDNFPREVILPLTGHARHAWFLVAGSTHPMHSQLDNGELLVEYQDGSTDRLPLHNPTTWWPIEADYDTAVDGYCIPGPWPPRVDLGAGRATILDLPLDPTRELKSLTVRCLANEVVVGLMSVTLQRR